MKINGIKKIFLTALAIISAAAVTGCSFSFGDTSDVNERHEELFPDKATASELKTSYIAYEFSLDGRGSMKVYVDTSEGHKFELDKENSGFIIKGKDGAEVLHAYCMDEETYKSAMAGIENVKNINGRDFFYEKVKDYHSLFSYMADCGLDCGMIMQSTDESAFGLVSFEGTPIEGASDDIYFYQGTASPSSEPVKTETEVIPTEWETTETAPTEIFLENEAVPTEAAAGKLVNSSLSPEAEELLVRASDRLSQDKLGRQVSSQRGASLPCYTMRYFKIAIAILKCPAKRGGGKFASAAVHTARASLRLA